MNKYYKMLIGVSGLIFIFCLVLLSLGKLFSNALVWIPLAFAMVLLFRTGVTRKDRFFEKFWMVIGSIWVFVLIYDIIRAI